MRELEGQVNGVDWLFKLEFFLYATSVAYRLILWFIFVKMLNICKNNDILLHKNIDLLKRLLYIYCCKNG